MTRTGASRDFASRDFASGDFKGGDFTSGEFDSGDHGAGGADARTECGGCANRAQHYHDLALEFLVMMRFAAVAQVRERYRMMGQHYLARAGAELARAREDQPPPGARRKRRRRTAGKAASSWAKAAQVFQLGHRRVGVRAAKAV